MNKAKLKPIYEIQKEAHERYRVNPRTFQWYVTKGLLPKAIKKGREAFYDLDDKKISVFDHLFVLKSLQNMYGLSTEKIKELKEKYAKQLKLLRKLLEELAKDYPAGIPLLSANWRVNKRFLEIISGDEKVDLKSIDLNNIAEDIRKEGEIF